MRPDPLNQLIEDLEKKVAPLHEHSPAGFARMLMESDRAMRHVPITLDPEPAAPADPPDEPKPTEP